MTAQARRKATGAENDAPRREFVFTDDDFKTVVGLAHEYAGISLADTKRNLVYGRLARRIRELGLPSFSAYLDHLNGDVSGTEIGNLLNCLTTNHTKFFRENHHFDHFAEHIIDPFLKSGDKRLRIWSAGCSTGEEPYTIALTLLRKDAARNGFDVRILATDLDTTVLQKGKNGVYDGASWHDIPSACRRFVTQNEQAHTVTIGPRAKSLIAYKQLNLMENWPIKGPFDAIFCRNVMIYFDAPTKERLVSRFVSLLKDDGFLYIGHAEALLNRTGDLVPAGRTIYRKRGGGLDG